MGLLSEFFVASPAEITEEVIRQGSAARYPTICATSFTDLAMALLLVVIEGRDLDEAVDRLDAFEIADVGEQGPWLVRLPVELRDALACASASDLQRYTTHWLEAEEMAGADPEYMTTLLERLSTLARYAQAENKCLYLRISL